MDYSKSIKSTLEATEFAQIMRHFKLDGRDNNVYLCTNNSFVFIFLEQNAVFLAIGLNRLCKSSVDPSSSLIDSIQVICLFQVICSNLCRMINL